MSDKVRENRMRRMARRQGLILQRSRRLDPQAVDYGLYALLSVETGGTIHPEGGTSIYTLTLDEVEGWLTDEGGRPMTTDFSLAPDLMENLDEWVNKLATPLLPPIENSATDRFEFREHMPHTVMIAKCVRVVSGIHAAYALANLGHVVECAALMRMVSDFCTEIITIGKAIELQLQSGGELPTPARALVERYFAPIPRTPDQNKKTQRPRYPSRKKLMEVETRWAEMKGIDGEIDQERAQDVRRFLNSTADAYVHDAYETTMELYDPHIDRFRMHGLRSRRKYREHVESVFLKLHEVVTALEFTAAITAHKEVFKATRDARRALDRRGWSRA